MLTRGETNRATRNSVSNGKIEKTLDGNGKSDVDAPKQSRCSPLRRDDPRWSDALPEGM
jgi:hypothetical protein